MTTILKWLGLALATAVALVAAAVGYVAATPIPHYPAVQVDFPVDVTPERVARGKRSAQMLCAGCHMDSTTGALTGKRMPDLPGQFGESWSRNITADKVKGIGSWTNGEIVYLLRTGIARDGRYTPPWMVKLPNASDEDLRDIVAFLRSDDPLVQARDVDDRESKPSLLTKVLCRVAWKPFPYEARPPAPAADDKVAYGRYLVTARLLCFSCHSADFKTNDDLHPEKSAGYLGGGNAMPDISGRIVHTRNLTPDPETGIGRWTEAQFRRALVDGIRPDNRPLRYPMVPYRPLVDEDVGAIYAYLRTVPPIRNAVPAPTAYEVPAGDDRGKEVYYSYGCNSCHGDTGHGQFDLRKGPAKYPTDDELIAWIRHPERTRPGITMPTWDGVIKEDEYVPLASYVRSLARGGSSAP